MVQKGLPGRQRARPAVVAAHLPTEGRDAGLEHLLLPGGDRGDGVRLRVPARRRPGAERREVLRFRRHPGGRPGGEDEQPHELQPRQPARRLPEHVLRDLRHLGWELQLRENGGSERLRSDVEGRPRRETEQHPWRPQRQQRPSHPRAGTLRRRHPYTASVHDRRQRVLRRAPGHVQLRSVCGALVQRRDPRGGSNGATCGLTWGPKSKDAALWLQLKELVRFEPGPLGRPGPGPVRRRLLLGERLLVLRLPRPVRADAVRSAPAGAVPVRPDRELHRQRVPLRRQRQPRGLDHQRGRVDRCRLQRPGRASRLRGGAGRDVGGDLP